MVMAALAQGLPVRFVPEQVRVAAMRLDMIHDCCRDEPSFLFASDAPEVTLQEELPGFLPLSRSHAAPRSSVRPGTAVHIRHNIFSHTAPALGIPDTCMVSAVFLAFVSSPASKKDRWLQASVLIFFLLIIVYLTEASDIKCCFSDIQ